MRRNAYLQVIALVLDPAFFVIVYIRRGKVIHANSMTRIQKNFEVVKVGFSTKKRGVFVQTRLQIVLWLPVLDESVLKHRNSFWSPI